MKQKQKSHFIPVLTSEAGSCLTLKNWQEIGVERVSYALPALLTKPGYALLMTLNSLASYTGWEGDVVLNATLPVASAEGIYTLRSPYNGSLIQFHHHDLFSLITQLKPNWVILPLGFATYLSQQQLVLPAATATFIPAQELLQNPHLPAFGCYVSDHFSQDLRRFNEMPLYFKDECNFALTPHHHHWFESDKPASDAMQGHVYSEEGIIEILEPKMANDHTTIDPNCFCPTCHQGFTRAYLHHLLTHTPLLAQRFLIHHNVYFISMGSDSIDPS